MSKQLAELQRENEYLKTRLREAGLLMPNIPLPTEEETSRLLALVETAHPRLVPPEGERAAHRIGFRNALSFLAHAYRTTKFSPYAATSHLDEAREFCSRYGLSGLVSLRSFLAACAACGVGMSSTEEFPFVDVCLSLGATSNMRCGWRDTLSAGRVLEPLPRKRRALPLASPVSIAGGMS
jgi:hypothetical protein